MNTSKLPEDDYTGQKFSVCNGCPQESCCVIDPTDCGIWDD